MCETGSLTEYMVFTLVNVIRGHEFDKLWAISWMIPALLIVFMQYQMRNIFKVTIFLGK